MDMIIYFITYLLYNTLMPINDILYNSSLLLCATLHSYRYCQVRIN